MLLRLFRTTAIVGLLFSAAPALAQPAPSGLAVVTAMDVAENYESYVDQTIEGMTENGLIGGQHSTVKDMTKLQGAVRQYLLDEKMQVLSVLAVSLEHKRSAGELTMLQLMLEAGVTIDQLPGQVSYSLKAEIYAAMSGHALVVAMGSRGRP